MSLVVAGVTVMLMVVSGCGSGSSSTESSGGGSAQFKATKKNKSIVDFGREATESEREAANSVLEANLRARAEAEFATQCASLTLRMVEEIAGSEGNDPAAACPSALKKLAEPLSSSKKVRKDTLGAPIAALRIKGNRGYALYHGNDGNDYAMPMEKEGGEWKVGSLLTTELG